MFAVALHRAFGWPVADIDEAYWTDPSDADNIILSVCHVYAVDENGLAWDVRDSRPVPEIPSEMRTWCHIGSLRAINSTRTDLRHYVGYWGEDETGELIDRPLYEYSDDDVAAAWEVAQRVLPLPLSALARWCLARSKRYIFSHHRRRRQRKLCVHPARRFCLKSMIQGSQVIYYARDFALKELPRL